MLLIKFHVKFSLTFECDEIGAWYEIERSSQTLFCVTETQINGEKRKVKKNVLESKIKPANFYCLSIYIQDILIKQRRNDDEFNLKYVDSTNRCMRDCGQFIDNDSLHKSFVANIPINVYICTYQIYLQ